MKDNICDLYGIEGYELFEKHRPTKAGGGVGLFIAQKVKYTKRDDLCYFDDYIECVSIEIGRTVFSTNRNVIVIYRPPNTDTRIFNERLNAVLNCVNNNCVTWWVTII